eukprot:Lankesteria_metandrocarpae@DN4989_c4_g2_i1.p2
MLNLPDSSLTAAAIEASTESEKVNSMYSKHKPLDDHQCARDYNAMCPAGWEQVKENDGSMCRVNADYKGPCAATMDFSAGSAREKSQLAADCKVHWPCLEAVCGPQGRNYAQAVMHLTTRGNTCPDCLVATAVSCWVDFKW